MKKAARKYRWLLILGFMFPLCVHAQTNNNLTDEETLYFGINPVAPFTGIRSKFTADRLPFLSNQETGASVFLGKIWNRNYNVETRLSFGSPHVSESLFLVQSGANYCFSTRKGIWHPYAGMFFKLYLLHERETKTDFVSTIAYLDVGNRFIWKDFFLDVRVNENITALSWVNQPGTKAKVGFHPSLYSWKSPYIPFASLNVGFFFR